MRGWAHARCTRYGGNEPRRADFDSERHVPGGRASSAGAARRTVGLLLGRGSGKQRGRGRSSGWSGSAAAAKSAPGMRSLADGPRPRQRHLAPAAALGRAAAGRGRLPVPRGGLQRRRDAGAQGPGTAACPLPLRASRRAGGRGGLAHPERRGPAPPRSRRTAHFTAGSWQAPAAAAAPGRGRYFCRHCHRLGGGRLLGLATARAGCHPPPAARVR